MSKWLYFGFRKWVFSTHPVVPWLVMSACSYYLRPNIKEVIVSNRQAIILSNSWHSVIYLKKKNQIQVFIAISSTCWVKLVLRRSVPLLGWCTFFLACASVSYTQLLMSRSVNWLLHTLSQSSMATVGKEVIGLLSIPVQCTLTLPKTLWPW